MLRRVLPWTVGLPAEEHFWKAVVTVERDFYTARPNLDEEQLRKTLVVRPDLAGKKISPARAIAEQMLTVNPGDQYGSQLLKFIDSNGE